MATLQLRNVNKRFGRHWGVRDLSLRVEDKEFVVLLGPSGCGKTTTIRLVAGLEELSAGSVLIGDRDVTHTPPRRRNVSMVFQNYAVWPHMTVYDNIAFPLRLRKVPEQRIREAVHSVAELTRIAPVLERHPDRLSGGQRQRVALARALAVEPELFLMDEPFSNLDARLRVAMRTELKTIHQRTRATTVFVTHDQAEAMSMADRIAVMHEGTVVQVGTPDEVYHRCASVFVAGFIGTPQMALFNVEVKRRAGSSTLRHPCFTLSVPHPAQPGLASFDQPTMILGVRPEDIVRCPPEAALFNRSAAVVEPQGSHQVVAVHLDRQLVKLILPPLPPVKPGDTLPVTFRTERLHCFDPDTKRRLTHAGTGTHDARTNAPGATVPWGTG